MYFQTTLKNQAVFKGIGLHSGRNVTVTLRPAESGTGIVFHRTDVSPPVTIEAIAGNVVSTRLCTTIGRNEVTVATIEHLMAALRGCGIDNTHIDIDGPEVPIMDGSATAFVAGIRSAGRVNLPRRRKYLVIKKAFSITDGDKQISILPSRHFKVSFDISFDHPAISSQSDTLTFSEEEFIMGIAPARTFGFLAEVEMLKANGLARGGSLDNAVVIDDAGVMNPEGLRFANEFVRHKILDSLGDMALLGYHLFGHVKAFKTGHDMNIRLVSQLLVRTDCWKLVEFTSHGDTIRNFPLMLPELAFAET
jgi:UDP-3-O-[3-hydroxymyristoyl] N-acetylglucosamine deacetylase